MSESTPEPDDHTAADDPVEVEGEPDNVEPLDDEQMTDAQPAQGRAQDAPSLGGEVEVDNDG